MNKFYALVLFLTALPGKAYSQQDTNVSVVLKMIPPKSISELIIYEKRTPYTDFILPRPELERSYTGQEMPSFLAKTPSITWYSDGGGFTGYSYMRLRGMDQTRINVTLNGVPLNEPEDQGAYFSNYPDFLNSIRNVQIVRGVGTSVNGTASFAGSIGLESTLLPDTAYTEISVSAGSFRTHRISAEFNTGLIKNKWAFYGRFSDAASNGFREHSGTDGQSFFFSGGYFSGKNRLKLTGFTGFSKNQMAYLAESDSVLKQNYRANSLTTNEKDEFKQTLVMLQHEYALGGNSTLQTSLYYNYLQGGYDILFAPDLYNFSVKSNFAGAIVNYSYIRRRWSLYAGLHANGYQRDHYSFIQPDESNLLYRNTGLKNEASAFAKANYETGRFRFSADLQYRFVQFRYHEDQNANVNISPVSWSFFNPKASVAYLLRRGNIVYLSVGKTSREPTRNDLFAGYDNLDSLTYAEIGGLERVKPESVLDFELGIKFTYKSLRVHFNLYDMEFKNEIAAIGQLSYIGLPLRKNVASSSRRGAELDLRWRLFERLTLTSQANLSINNIKEYTTDYDSITYRNVQPLLTPQAVVNLSADYAFTRWLLAGISGRYVSQSFLDNTNNPNFEIPASFILNASVSANFLRKYSVELMVNNITGQKYYSSGYVQGGQPYYFAMATRNYFVTFKFRF